jgi:hypothetical protein
MPIHFFSHVAEGCTLTAQCDRLHCTSEFKCERRPNETNTQHWDRFLGALYQYGWGVYSTTTLIPWTKCVCPGHKPNIHVKPMVLDPHLDGMPIAPKPESAGGG